MTGGAPAGGRLCPPISQHRDFFKLSAPDAELGELREPTQAGLERAVAGHLLA